MFKSVSEEVKSDSFYDLFNHKTTYSYYPMQLLLSKENFRERKACSKRLSEYCTY
jgi:hypothetical protein